MFFKLSKALLSATLVLSGVFFFGYEAFAALELVKSVDFGTVYYIDSRGLRHPFPNEMTYRSWYGNDFSRVVTVSSEVLKNYPLGKNITIRPGTFLVKVPTAPAVYAVEQGGLLREIQNESIAAAIYGDSWAERVVDIPDVFFDDYRIGAPIVHDYTTPDSILYKDQNSDTYFYLNNRMLRRFSSLEAVEVNHFDVSFAIEANKSFFIRERPINGFDHNVFNPIAEPLVDRRDCAAGQIKAAIILVANKNASSAEIDRLQKIKQAIPDAFSEASRGLSAIDMSYPTTIMLDDGYLITRRNDNTTEIRNEVINTFYDSHPDDFDFIFVFSNFAIPDETHSNEIASFLAVSNRQEGLGRSMLDASSIFGSSGKLKGIITMGNINKYDTTTLHGLTNALNIVNHEILHQWAAYIKVPDALAETSDVLLRLDDKKHWSIYAGFISPLGGSGWVDNGNGTFTSGLLTFPDTKVKPFSDLDLYLMGLIPYQLMGDVFYLESKMPDAVGNTIAAAKKMVSIEQIIKANGRLQCDFLN